MFTSPNGSRGSCQRLSPILGSQEHLLHTQLRHIPVHSLADLARSPGLRILKSCQTDVEGNQRGMGASTAFRTSASISVKFCPVLNAIRFQTGENLADSQRKRAWRVRFFSCEAGLSILKGPPKGHGSKLNYKTGVSMTRSNRYMTPLVWATQL